MDNRRPLYDRDRPLRRDAARNRQILIQAAREVFAARGIDASMDDIAAHAQLGVGTAYRHFANKYELANSIFDDAVEQLVRSAERVSTDDDSWDALVVTVESLLTAQAENRAIRDIILCLHPDDCERHDQLLAPLVRTFERAQRDGLIVAGAEYGDVATIVVMLCALSDWVGDQSPDLWRRYLPALLETVRSGSAVSAGGAHVTPLTRTQLRNIAVRGAYTRARVS